jgi:hypothetical protein
MKKYIDPKHFRYVGPLKAWQSFKKKFSYISFEYTV